MMNLEKDLAMDIYLKGTRRVSTSKSKKVPVNKVVQRKNVRGPDSPLYAAICPLVYGARLFGLAPYEFHNEMLIPSSINSIYAYVCIATYTYIIYTILLRFTSIEMEEPLLGHTETVKAAVNYIVATIDIVLTMFSRKKFVRIWNVMQDYDEIVRNLGYPRSETKTCIWTWIILCMNTLVWVAVNKTGMYAFAEPWLNNVAYLLIYVASSVSVIKFSGIVMLLGQRFDHLNFMAKKSGPLASRWLRASPSVDSKDIEYLHNVLMLASERLNSLYSWSLLMWLANLCWHIVSDFYFMIQRLMVFDWDLSTWKVFSCLMTWNMAFIGQLVLLNFACHFVATEANRMGSIMINWRRWIRRSGRNRCEACLLQQNVNNIPHLSITFFILNCLYEKDLETSIHLINRSLHFSAAGCFYVNLPLLRSIVALLTTYLVILLQFSGQKPCTDKTNAVHVESPNGTQPGWTTTKSIDLES